ncbi:MAG TPA: OmpH family outer membrane protein, partial [Verrucomicrobiae bacterium]|nr:OmpH family outer membrane protein [Verrucomicrobiae bacterium]
MKKRNWIPAVVAMSCALSLMFSLRAAAEVSDADFKALQDAVKKLSDQMQAMQQTNALQEKLHAEDVQKIKELQDKLSQTQNAAATAEQKTAAVAGQAQAQPVLGPPIDEATVNHNFMMLGDAEFQWDRVQGEHPSFLLADFAPIFLYRGGDNVLFEAGFDTTLANNAPNSSGYTTTFNLSFAQLDYVMNDYMTLAVGDLLLPLGTYSVRSAGWLNLFPDNPLAVDALLPGAGVGAELMGAVPIGTEGKYLNYSIYGVNGPSSADGTANAGALDLGGNVGVRSDSVMANLHSNPSGGARVGLFVPFAPHYDFEV